MTQDKPTEARQDELAIRERIADIVWGINNGEAGCLSKADQILSLTVSSGGVCPECKGRKQTYFASDRIPLQDCTACNGTGQKPIVTKELREIIKENGGCGL